MKTLDTIQRTSFMLAIGVLLLVIYPLHFIPLAPNESPTISFKAPAFMDNLCSLKGVILLIFGSTRGSIFAYFMVLTKRLKKRYVDSSKAIKDTWLNIGHFSEYF